MACMQFAHPDKQVQASLGGGSIQTHSWIPPQFDIALEIHILRPRSQSGEVVLELTEVEG
jgi:hypothetical protein